MVCERLVGGQHPEELEICGWLERGVVRDLALHEVGHMAIAYLCELPVYEVSINRDKEGVHGVTKVDLGHVTVTDDDKISLAIHKRQLSPEDKSEIIERTRIQLDVLVAGIAVEQAAYYFRYNQRLNLFDAAAGIYGVNFFTTWYGRHSFMHPLRVQARVRGARGDMRDIAELLGVNPGHLTSSVMETFASREFISGQTTKSYEQDERWRRFINNWPIIDSGTLAGIVIDREQELEQWFAQKKVLRKVEKMAGKLAWRRDLTEDEVTRMMNRSRLRELWL